MSKLSRLIVLGLGAALIAAPAAAVTPGMTDVVVQSLRADQDAVIVPTADLKLQTPAGQRALMSRVGFAIASMCNSTDLGNPHYSLKCSNEARASVEPQLARLLNR